MQIHGHYFRELWNNSSFTLVNLKLPLCPQMFRLNGLYFHDYFREKMIVKVINILPFSLKFQSSKYVDSLAVLSGQLL